MIANDLKQQVIKLNACNLKGTGKAHTLKTLTELS